MAQTKVHFVDWDPALQPLVPALPLLPLSCFSAFFAVSVCVYNLQNELFYHVNKSRLRENIYSQPVHTHTRAGRGQIKLRTERSL